MWAAKVFISDYNDPKTWECTCVPFLVRTQAHLDVADLDKVGVMHTGLPGFKHRENKEPLNVDLQACSSLTLCAQNR